MQLNRYIDYTLLRPDALPLEMEDLCRKAIEREYHAVCLPPCYVPLAKDLLKDSVVKVCTVVGFPLGFNATATKVKEAAGAAEWEVNEIDFVQNIGWLKSRQWDLWEREIQQILEAVPGKITKVILETGLLTFEEIMEASRRAEALGVNYIKTCTGFGPRGVNLEDVRTISQALRGNATIKASGGIRSRSFALELIQAGATRIGTSTIL